MAPAVRQGDWLLVWRGIRPGRPMRIRPGQIVIAQHPSQADLLLVKRAVERHANGWWLASDNTTAPANDSRSFGPVSVGLIRGRVLMRYGRAPG
jgi:nickel-type superoxide dismutase maturation protease